MGLDRVRVRLCRANKQLRDAHKIVRGCAEGEHPATRAVPRWRVLRNPPTGHCQVNRYGDACGRAKRDKVASCYLVDAGLLSPDLERLRASAAIAGCGHQMAPWPKVIVDDRMRRQEPLRLIGRLEPLHLPLSSSRGSMRVFSSIIQVSARPMADIRQDRPLSDAIAAQAVRDEASWLVPAVHAAGA